MNSATDRQLEVLRFIEKHRKTRGFAPSMREIGTELGIGSTNGVKDHLRALEAKGLVEFEYATARSFKATRKGRAALGMLDAPQVCAKCRATLTEGEAAQP